MTIRTTKYVRKPLYVEAIQITRKNFEDLAKWCQGEIYHRDNHEKIEPDEGFDSDGMYIRIRVHNPKSIRQTQGFVGDWILYTERGYKVYTQKAFKASFEPTDK
jgi:hypothetical protein